MKNPHRPALQFAAWLVAVVLALLGLLGLTAKPDNRIEQVFYGPVNAPVNTCLSADQEVDFRGQVRP